MAIKKFGDWCNQNVNEDVAMSGLGTTGKYAAQAASRGAAKTYNPKQVETLVNTFVSQFTHPTEQRMLVKMLRSKLLHAKDMFKSEAEVPQ